MYLRILFISVLFLAGCKGGSHDIPPGVISRDSMVIIMADFHIAEARIMKSGSKLLEKNVKSAYLQQVLSTAGVDTSRFLKSFDYYSSQPDIFAEMYEDVVVVISKRQAEAKEVKK